MVGKVETINDILLKIFEVCSMGPPCRENWGEILSIECLNERCPAFGQSLWVQGLLPASVCELKSSGTGTLLYRSIAHGTTANRNNGKDDKIEALTSSGRR